MCNSKVGKPRRRIARKRIGKPSAQGNAQKSTQSNCVGMKTPFNPPVPLYTYDHLHDVKEDLYAGDISVDYFIKNILSPVANAAYDDYKRPVISPFGMGLAAMPPRQTREEFVREYNQKFITKSDSEHIKSWKNMVEWVSIGLESVVLECVDKATTTKFSSMPDIKDANNRKEFTDISVNKEVALHDHLIGNTPGKRNLSNIQKALVAQIKSKGVNIRSYKTTTNDSRSIVNLVAFNTYTDKVSGLGMLTNGTMGYKVEVVSYTCLGPNKGEIQYRYTIYDHFGLDEQDVSLNDARPHMQGFLNTAVNSRTKFLSWFYLQRVRGFRPVVVKIANEYKVSTEYAKTKHVK